MLKIYNSFTKQKEIFTPIASPKVRMYVCGITVYDYCHLGHARTAIAFDIVYRYLQARGFDVNYVQNITDIDDKIINRAVERKIPVNVLTEEFIQAMNEDFAALGILRQTQNPRATEFVAQMQAMIQKLIDSGYAYVAQNKDVYYAVKKFNTYGALSNRVLEDMEAGSRVDINEDKRDPFDFVLWKHAKVDEPSWTSPWGDGRPGWHIECSAMAKECLGETIDIHGGGHDLLFPHHENERAQSESANQKKFVNIWMHIGFLEVNKEKMSKSLGNFFTIREILAVHDPEVIRLFVISSHYRKPVNYTEDILIQTRAALERLYLALRGHHKPEGFQLPADNLFVRQFYDAMDDDFNTPLAISVLFELASEVNRLRETQPLQADTLAATLRSLGGMLGLLQRSSDDFLKGGSSAMSLSEAEIMEYILQREHARATQNWQEADRIRNVLAEKRIILEDGASGTTWRFLSS